MTTVVVIGATGYAGAHLVREMLDRDHQVIGIARDVAAVGTRQRLSLRGGSLVEPAGLADVLGSADVVAVATHARLDGGVSVAGLLPSLIAAAGPGRRLGGDVMLVDDTEAPTAISGTDFATAFVDEIETPRHRRQRFTVGY